MRFLNEIAIKLCSGNVGCDKYGNKYYQSKSRDYLGHNKRYVIYGHEIEPSTIPPLWHAWLHHASDEIPKQEKLYDWQVDYSPNLTGTKYAFNPKQNIIAGKIKKYISWQPK